MRTINQERCNYCGACITECPMYAIKWTGNWSEEMVVVTDKCTDCVCPAADACPCEAIEEANQ